MKGERLPGACKACGNTRAMLTDQPKGVRGVCARCTEEALDEARALLAAEQAAHAETRRELAMVEAVRAATERDHFAAMEELTAAQAAQRVAEARAAEAEARLEVVLGIAEWEDGRAVAFNDGDLFDALNAAGPPDANALATYIQSLPDDHPAIAGRLDNAWQEGCSYGFCESSEVAQSFPGDVVSPYATTQPTTDEGGSDG